MNMILILGQYVINSDMIHIEGSAFYINEIIEWFLLFVFCCIAFIMVFFVVLTIALIKIEVINPIQEIIYHVQTP